MSVESGGQSLDIQTMSGGYGDRCQDVRPKVCHIFFNLIVLFILHFKVLLKLYVNISI